MKAILIKERGYYDLYRIDKDGKRVTFASTEDYKQKLSKQNCDEIFRVTDVEKLAEEYGSKFAHSYDPEDFIAGFNKAMELNKDKLFTLEDLEKVWDRSADYRHNPIHENSFGECIKSLQQPTEIEVEIEMICPHPMDTYRCGLQYGCDGDGCNHPNQIPYLDSEGCLILKKI